MLVGPSGVGDRGEKGDVVGCINTLLGVDDSSVVLISVGGVDGSDEVEGHSAMVSAVAFLTKVGVFKGVFSSDVDSRSWSELVILEGGEDSWVTVDECPEAGRGHDGGDSSN